MNILVLQQYVGDSETDLMCLLDADVGVIMNSKGMIDKCEKLGLRVLKGSELIQKGDSVESIDSNSLLAVEDFTPFL